MYRLLADAVVVAHLLFVGFVIGGGLLVLRRPSLGFLHLPATAWGAFIEFSGGICPLTPLENHLRGLDSHQGAYGGGFIERYLLPLIYPEELTAAVQYLLGSLVLLINIPVYLLLIRKYRRPGSRGK